jgi:hypothetical protein
VSARPGNSGYHCACAVQNDALSIVITITSSSSSTACKTCRHLQIISCIVLLLQHV